MNLLSFFNRKKSLEARQNSGVRAKRKNPYHAVQVVFPIVRACEAAKKLKGQTFLSGEAPRIPAEDCSDPLTCACRYRHFPDRRRKMRRDSDFGFPLQRITNDRRIVTDRRA